MCDPPAADWKALAARATATTLADAGLAPPGRPVVDPLFASATGELLSTNNVRQRVVEKNELLGTSPAATGSAHLGPNSGPNSLLVPGGRGAPT
jgi:hypothetical protein